MHVYASCIQICELKKRKENISGGLFSAGLFDSVPLLDSMLEMPREGQSPLTPVSHLPMGKPRQVCARLAELNGATEVNVASFLCLSPVQCKHIKHLSSHNMTSLCYAFDSSLMHQP